MADTTPKPFTARLKPLEGKHYGTIINVRDEQGYDYEIAIWTKDLDHRMSQRELDDYGYKSNEEAREDGMPCDCHYESERDFLLAQEIVKAINSFRLPND